MNKKAQIAAETILAISILLLFLTTTVIYSFSQKNWFNELTLKTKKENECLRLSMIISSIYSSGENSYYTTTLDYNVFFGLTYIAVNDANNEAKKGVYCNHFALLNSEKSFNETRILISNTNRKVSIQNA